MTDSPLTWTPPPQPPLTWTPPKKGPYKPPPPKRPILPPARPLPADRSAVSSDGWLTVVSDSRLPGVLIRYESPYGPTGGLRVIQAAGADGVWRTVASGFPLRWNVTRAGTWEAHAYDFRVSPGGVTTYRVTLATPEGMSATRVASSVSISIPHLPHCTAWLKHLGRPDLTTRVNLQHPLPRTVRGAVTMMPVLGRHPHAAQGGVSSVAHTLTIRVEDDAVAVQQMRATLETPGTFLLQASYDHGIEECYLAWDGGEIDEDRHETEGWRLRDFVVPVVQVGEPGTWEAPLLMPGVSWASQARPARRWADYAAQYPTAWDALVAGTGTEVAE